MKIKHKWQFSIDYGITGLTAGNWSVIILYQISIISMRIFFFFSSVSKDNLKMFKTETNIQLTCIKQQFIQFTIKTCVLK